MARALKRVQTREIRTHRTEVEGSSSFSEIRMVAGQKPAARLSDSQARGKEGRWENDECLVIPPLK